MASILFPIMRLLYSTFIFQHISGSSRCNELIMLCFQTDANHYGVDWECPTPVVAVTDNFVQLPDCDLREGQLNILQGLNPLTHSEEYGIDIIYYMSKQSYNFKLQFEFSIKLPRVANYSEVSKGINVHCTAYRNPQINNNNNNS